MLIRSLKLESRAYRAYRNNDPADSDLETEEDRDWIHDELESKKPTSHKLYEIMAETLPTMSSVDDDELYEGGKSSKKKKGQENKGCFGKILSLGPGKGRNNSNTGFQKDFNEMSEHEKKQRIQYLWAKARRYNNKLRFQARLQKMAESNLKEMMIDDINEDVNEDNQVSENQPKLKWYLIDTERTFCKVWNFWITLLIIYNLIVTPFVLVFPTVYYDDSQPEG